MFKYIFRKIKNTLVVFQHRLKNRKNKNKEVTEEKKEVAEDKKESQ